MLEFLSLAGIARSALAAVVQWLSRRSLSEIVCICLALALILTGYNRNHWKHVATERQAQLVALQEKLTKIDSDSRSAAHNGNRISKQLKDKNDEDNRRIAGDAQSLRVSGPGKAVCRPAPAAPSGHKQAAPDAGAARPVLPAPDSAAVPWPWLVQRAEEHDQLLAEVQAWRTWHDEVLKVWPKNK